MPLWIRIPLWVKRNDLVISGAAASPEFVNGYLFMAEPPASLVTVDFPPVQEELVSTYLRRIRARLQGKQVLQMENFGADRTFFDALT